MLFFEEYNNVKKLREEALRRIRGFHISADMIGVELKLRRKQLALTLSDVSENICSVSYLCKIEQSKIKANRASLHDICLRLGIAKEAIEALMKSDKLLIGSIKAYFNNDEKALIDYHESCKNLRNYRVRILNLIYLIYFKKYDEAFELANELIKLSSVLNDIDLVVFTIFYDILNFNKLNNKDIYDSLKAITSIVPLDDSIIYLIEILKIKCLFTMNSPLILESIEKISLDLVKISRFDLIEELKFIKCMFYLFNKEYEAYEYEIKFIHNDEYLKSLNMYKKIIIKDVIKKDDLASLKGFSYLVALATIDGPKALELVDRSEIICNDLEFDLSIIEYLTLKTIEEKYNFILTIALPQFKALRNKIVAKFYVDELLIITENTNKYKLFYQMYSEIYS